MYDILKYTTFSYILDIPYTIVAIAQTPRVAHGAWYSQWYASYTHLSSSGFVSNQKKRLFYSVVARVVDCIQRLDARLPSSPLVTRRLKFAPRRMLLLVLRGAGNEPVGVAVQLSRKNVTHSRFQTSTQRVRAIAKGQGTIIFKTRIIVRICTPSEGRPADGVQLYVA